MKFLESVLALRIFIGVYYNLTLLTLLWKHPHILIIAAPWSEKREGLWFSLLLKMWITTAAIRMKRIGRKSALDLRLKKSCRALSPEVTMSSICTKLSVPLKQREVYHCLLWHCDYNICKCSFPVFLCLLRPQEEEKVPRRRENPRGHFRRAAREDLAERVRVGVEQTWTLHQLMVP